MPRPRKSRLGLSRAVSVSLAPEALAAVTALAGKWALSRSRALDRVIAEHRKLVKP